MLHRIVITAAVMLFLAGSEILAAEESFSSLMNRADSLLDCLQFDSAIPAAEKALLLAEESGEHDSVIARIHLCLGKCHFEKHELKEARIHSEQAVMLFESSVDSLNEDFADGLYCLGASMGMGSNQYEEAWPIMLRSLSLKERIFGPDNPKLGRNLIGLASTARRLGKYVLAERYVRRAADIFGRSLPKDDPKVAMLLLVLGDVCRDKGHYRESLSPYSEALAIHEAAHDKPHKDVALSMERLAAAYYALGDYVQAEEMFQSAADIFGTVFGQHHYVYANCRFRLGQVYRTQGRLEDARRLFEQSLPVLEIELGLNHLLTASCRSSLARLYLEMGNTMKADSLLREALTEISTAVGDTSTYAAVIVANLADIAFIEDNLSEADSLYRLSMAVLEAAYGPDHPYISACLSGQARIAMKRGDITDARRSLEIARALAVKGYGKSHPTVARLLENLADCHWLNGDSVQALDLDRKAIGIRQRNLRIGAMVMSEMDALDYCRSLRNSVNRYISKYVLLDHKDRARTAEAAGMILETKGLISDEIFERRKSFIASDDPEVDALLTQLRVTQCELSSLFIRNLTGDTISQESKCDSLAALAEDIEAELARESKEYRQRVTSRDISLEDVISALPDSSVLVEYFVYDRDSVNSDETTTELIAMVIDYAGSLSVVSLGPADIIDSLILEYREHMLAISSAGLPPSPDDLSHYSGIAECLFNRIWSPLCTHTANKRMVIISPDGALNMLSFAGLTDGSGPYLIEQQAIHYLSSARDLVRLKEGYIPGKGLLAMGDPDFDIDTEIGQTEESTLSVPSGRLYPHAVQRSTAADFRTHKALRLPGTKREVLSISSAWKELTSEPVTVLMGREACEESFKSQAPGYRVIHLATHGFFLENDSQTVVNSENPLLASGLLLAGANGRRLDESRSAPEDGILTAYEVAGMNLEGTELVALSGCETGLGGIRTGEGIYGLRRAFLTAGARAVLSSMWQIPDASTAEYMKRLYARSEASLPICLRSIALKDLDKLRKRGQPDHPYNWAAFVAVGDPFEGRDR